MKEKAERVSVIIKRAHRAATKELRSAAQAAKDSDPTREGPRIPPLREWAKENHGDYSLWMKNKVRKTKSRSPQVPSRGPAATGVVKFKKGKGK